ncbi:dihydrofolate reductase [Diorhabda sublineata]|uniref:dihydrofolate reductase n=1 Tax=Diorhabda sublineata TaxID=1163346 RepID=UPI0024E06535|nr:dihydrofolate reductase [Diorhabda sublineata]
MALKLNVIAAACENMGIGKNNNLPWKLKTEMEYFTKMTTTTRDPCKKNIVIMGHNTWNSIHKKFKPLKGRINFILSRSDLNLRDYGDVYVFKSFRSCLDTLEGPEFKDIYERIWVIGGSQVYKEAVECEHFYRLYLTKILKEFDCDTFFPELPSDMEEVKDDSVPEGVQSEGDINFTFNVYQNMKFK